jgi:hypothetical protein
VEEEKPMEESKFYDFKIDIEDRVSTLEGEVERIWSAIDKLRRKLGEVV